jgi:hypothetical protein
MYPLEREYYYKMLSDAKREEEMEVKRANKK